MITRDDKKERLLKGRGLLKRRGLLKGRGLLSREKAIVVAAGTRFPSMAIAVGIYVSNKWPNRLFGTACEVLLWVDCSPVMGWNLAGHPAFEGPSGKVSPEGQS
jgi:hypothetical protein